jgi:hypothetical protein
MWQFAVPLLFMEIFVDTLLPSALVSLVVHLFYVFAIPSVGSWWSIPIVGLLCASLSWLRTFLSLSVPFPWCSSSSRLALTASINRSGSPSHLILFLGVTLACGAVGQGLTCSDLSHRARLGRNHCSKPKRLSHLPPKSRRHSLLGTQVCVALICCARFKLLWRLGLSWNSQEMNPALVRW